MATDINSLLGSLTTELQKLVRQMSNTAAATHDFGNKTRDTAADVEDYLHEIVKGRKLTKQQNELMEKARKAKEHELKLAEDMRKAQDKLRQAQTKFGKNSEQYARQQTTLNSLTRQHTQAQKISLQTGAQLQQSFKGLISGVNLAGAALTWFGQGLMNTIKLSKEQMVANEGLIEGTDYFSAMMAQQGEAFKKGISAIDYAKMTRENRQLINAMGGSINTFKTHENVLTDFYVMTGDLAKAHAMLLQAQTSFAVKGIRPTARAMEAYKEDIVTLQAQTGMGAEAAMAFYDSINDDIDSIALLRQAREGEREAILKSQRAMVQNAIAAGMSAEQAKEAAKMLNKMVAEKPLDRIKKAAKMRALAGAYGVSGGEEAAKALIAGPRASAEQKQLLADFQTRMTNVMDKQAQRGLGSEITGSVLMDKLGLTDQYGPSSAFSTTLSDVMAKNAKDVVNGFARASQSIVGQGWQKIDQIAGWVEQIAKGTIVWNAILTGFQSIYNFFTGESATNWIYQSIERAIPNLATAIGDVFGTAIDLLRAPLDLMVGLLSKALSLIPGSIGAFFSKQADKSLGTGSSIDNLSSMWGPKGAAANQVAQGQSLNRVQQQLYASGAPASTTGAPLTPRPVATPISAATQAVKSADADREAQKRSETIQTATTSTADGIQAQLAKMDSHQALMKTLVENSNKQLELAEKQLLALTTTDEEKQSGTQKNLRKDSRFAAQYGYAS